jgi:hypothetical protein
MLGAQKAALFSGAPADPPNADEIKEDDDFTVIKTKKKPSKPKATPTVTDTAMNTALPTSPTIENQESGSSQHNKNQFLTTSRQNIPPVIIHHHFHVDITRLNKDFHTQFQPIGFTPFE